MMPVRSFRKTNIQLVCLPIVLIFIFSCASSKNSFNPNTKYTPAQLQHDYSLFRNVLEELHPSLYWFTPKDSMDYFFDWGYAQLRDSMNERDFRTLLNYITSKIKCGHTTTRYSKKYTKYLDTAKLKLFPLNLKLWSDTMVVTATLNRRDSILRRGTLIKSINNYTAAQIIDSVFNYMPADGNAIVGKYQMLSNRGNFGTTYKNVFGLTDTLLVTYANNLNEEKILQMPVYDPGKDTSGRAVRPSEAREKRSGPRTIILNSRRNVQIDTTLSSAYMTLNTFSRGSNLSRFYRKTFREIKKRNIKHLVIDVRSNGGGDVGNSTLLTQYIINKKFKIADSLYAIKRKSNYSSYIQWQPVYWLMMQFITKKRADGKYHFGYFEKHYFKPRKKFHYTGNVYILTGGNSFSATTLFAKALKGQDNVKIVGEETGGGAYGNTAFMIPDVRLPNTGIRFRLPRFRLVMDKDLVKEGRGVMPDIEVGPSLEAIRKGYDPKVEAVKKMIMEKNGEQ